MGWPAEHDAALKDLLEKGCPFSEIAKELNEKFGTAYSRNACIGRARRKGLASPNAPCHYDRTAVKARTQKRRQVTIVRRTFKLAAPVVEGAAQITIRCAEVQPRHLSFLELDEGLCNYPYGDTSFTYCGHPVLKGFPYCPPHVALTTKAA